MVENTRLRFASQRLQHVVDGSGGVQFGSFDISSDDRVLFDLHGQCSIWCGGLGGYGNQTITVDRRVPFPTHSVGVNIPVAGLFVATQYEIPFKLSISTFHVSVMAITPAIVSHKVRHPSWCAS